jgi:hypothetical protein
MGFLKQNEVEGPKKKTSATKGKRNADAVKVIVGGPDDSHNMRTHSMQHDINYVNGLDGIEQSLDWIAKGISKLTSDEHSISLCTGYTDPVKLTLAGNDYDDTMGRVVTAIERIADSLAHIAGLGRPRLEPWHDQDSYNPPFRDSACDGGAPGPATKG